jgi:hypothetical protein
MNEHQHHEELIKGLSDQLKQIFEKSEQGIYLYLDDTHKICNQKMASMLGFKTTREWAETTNSFLDKYVARESQKILVDTYEKAMEKMVGSTIKVEWKSKSGDLVRTTVILVPISYSGHLFALHFVFK